MKAAPFYTFGRAVDLHFAGPLLLQMAAGCVDGHAVCGGFAAANRMAVYIGKGLVQRGVPGRV